MEQTPLTKHACDALWNGNTDFKPIMQCLEARALQAASGNPSSTERFRISLSDGDHFIHAMLATQLVDYVKNGRVGPGTIIKLTEYLCNVVHGRKITIVLNLEVLGSRPVQGNPQNIASKGAVSQAPAGAAGMQGGQQPQHQLGYGSHQNAPPPAMQSGHQPQHQLGYGSHQTAPPPVMQTGHQPQHHHPQHQPQAGGYSAGYQSAPSYGKQEPYGTNPSAQPQQMRMPVYNKENVQNIVKPGQPLHQHQQQAPSVFQQVSTNYVPKGAISRTDTTSRIVPVKSLNPYLNRWTIQARVTHKGDIRRWQNAKGEGTVFNFDVVDINGGEIRICAFKESCEKFYPLIEVGKVYMISKGALRPARKQYNPLDNDFEIYLETNSSIEPCVEDAQTCNIPSITFNFKQILSLDQLPAGTLVDVIGVVLTADACVTIQRRDGTETQKRTVTIKDDSNAVIELTLWGSYSMDPGQSLEMSVQQGSHPVVAVKSSRVGEYNGKTLGTISSTQVLVNPDLPEAGRLRHWYDQGGSQQQAVQLRMQSSGGGDRRIVLSDIRDEALGTHGKADYVECLAGVTFVKTEPMSYPACSLQRNNRMCNKKVTLTDGGEGWCETCQQKCKCEWRWILQLTVADHSAKRWVTVFGDTGNEIMGITANEMKQYENTDAFDALLAKATITQYKMKFKIQEETYNEESRVKVSIMNVSKPDWTKESALKLDKIREILPATQDYNNGDNAPKRHRVM